MRQRGVRILLIEDGCEYEEFVRAFLPELDLVVAHDGAEALAALERGAVDALLVDLRFERTPDERLVGDVPGLARRAFGGDEERARRWLRDQQGTLVLEALRAHGFVQRAVFVHAFAPERLANLRRLYGDVVCVPGFDAKAMRAALVGEHA